MIATAHKADEPGQGAGERNTLDADGDKALLQRMVSLMGSSDNSNTRIAVSILIMMVAVIVIPVLVSGFEQH